MSAKSVSLSTYYCGTVSQCMLKSTDDISKVFQEAKRHKQKFGSSIEGAPIVLAGILVNAGKVLKQTGKVASSLASGDIVWLLTDQDWAQICSSNFFNEKNSASKGGVLQKPAAPSGMTGAQVKELIAAYIN